MKILVFADSHGDTSFMADAINEHKNDTDLIIHLGNNASDTSVINSICGHIASVFILGNGDVSVRDIYTEHSFELGNTGIRAFACHGHTYNVHEGTEQLYYRARYNNAKIALYGHTHIANITERLGMYIINPGSCSRPRSNEPASYAVINIENGIIMPAIIYRKD